MFIDRDIGWKCRTMALIRAIEGRGGTYPRRPLPISLNYNVLPEIAAKFNNRRKNFEDHQQLKKLADPVTGEIEMLHIPTGFMMIDISVFHALADKCVLCQSRWVWRYAEKGQRLFSGACQRWHHGVRRLGLCTICRENGIPSISIPIFICDHTGSYTFDVPR